MKTNKFMRMASVMLVAVLLSTCAISGTFAKYTSEKSAEDSARVAKWSFTVGDKDIANEDFTFDLFKTITDDDGTTAETDLSATDGTIIAPGTSGKFDIVLTNASEVTAKYAIDYTVTKSDNTIPIQFSVDGGTNWSADLTDVAASEGTATSTVLAHTNGTKTITVQWKWAYEGNDTTDTTLGIAGNATVTVNAKITATQVD